MSSKIETFSPKWTPVGAAGARFVRACGASTLAAIERRYPIAGPVGHRCFTKLLAVEWQDNPPAQIQPS
jgi:hypothetical protein